MRHWLSTRCDRHWCWRRNRQTIWPLNNEPRVQRCLRHQWTAEDYAANSRRFNESLRPPEGGGMSDCPHNFGDLYERRMCTVIGPDHWEMSPDGEQEMWVQGGPEASDELVSYTPTFCPDCGVRLTDTREGPDNE